jgi:hypothetical protein
MRATCLRPPSRGERALDRLRIVAREVGDVGELVVLGEIHRGRIEIAVGVREAAGKPSVLNRQGAYGCLTRSGGLIQGLTFATAKGDQTRIVLISAL